MKFIIDAGTNPPFIQILGLTEHFDGMTYPIGWQLRGGIDMLVALDEVLDAYFERMEYIEQNYSTDNTARAEFDMGGVLTSDRSNCHVALLYHQRFASIVINSSQIGRGIIPVRDLSQAVKAFFGEPVK